uniref:Uncharacterized protein n=1 Tax=Syphacia muris TaxID=451379 RepID=A0A0N5A7Y9_9BILA
MEYSVEEIQQRFQILTETVVGSFVAQCPNRSITRSLTYPLCSFLLRPISLHLVKPQRCSRISPLARAQSSVLRFI